MRRKIIIFLLALFLVSVAGAATATFYIRNITQTLSRLIKLHQIEDFRRDLVISIQTVQSELYTVGTALAPAPEVISGDVERLKRAAGVCDNCHDEHPPDVLTSIGLVQTDVRQYEGALQSYFAAVARKESANKLKLDAAEIGNRLLSRTGKMSLEASEKLSSTSAAARSRVQRVQVILTITQVLTFIAGILIAVNLTRSITRPVDLLVGATRALAQGELGHTITHQDKPEFGELADHFNAMSMTLKDGYTMLEQEIVERKQIQAALVESEGFLNTIFDSIRDPFCIIDRSYRIVRANEAYARMKESRLDDLVGTVCYESLYERTTVCNDCIIQETFTTGEPSAKEKSISNTDGKAVWLAIYTYPILDRQGTVTHVVE